MSLSSLYQKLKKKKEEVFTPAKQKISSGVQTMSNHLKKAKNYFDEGVGEVADKSLDVYSKSKKIKDDIFSKDTQKSFKSGNLGERTSRGLENNFKFFTPAPNKVRPRDFVRELPKAIGEVPKIVRQKISTSYNKTPLAESIRKKSPKPLVDKVSHSIGMEKLQLNDKQKEIQSSINTQKIDIAKKQKEKPFIQKIAEFTNVKDFGFKNDIKNLDNLENKKIEAGGEEYKKQLADKHDRSDNFIAGFSSPLNSIKKPAVQGLKSLVVKARSSRNYEQFIEGIKGEWNKFGNQVNLLKNNNVELKAFYDKAIETSKTTLNKNLKNVVNISKKEKLAISPFKNNYKENFDINGKLQKVEDFKNRAIEKKGNRIKELKGVLFQERIPGYKQSEVEKMFKDEAKLVSNLSKLGYSKPQINSLKGDWDRAKKIIDNKVSWPQLKEYYAKKKSLETNFLDGIDPSTIKDINPLMTGGRDVYRNFEVAFGKNFPQIKKALLDPFDMAKGNMMDEQKILADELFENIVKKLGIKKGSKLDKAVVGFGERKITLKQLQQVFPKSWQRVVKADKWFKEKYPQLLEDLNKIREDNFPTHPLYPESSKIIPKRNDYYRHGKDLEGITGLKNLFETSASIDPALASSSDVTNPKTKWLSLAQKRTGEANDFGAVEGYIDYIKNHSYAKHIDPFIQKFKGVDDEAKDLLPRNISFKEPENIGLAEEMGKKFDPIRQIAESNDIAKIKEILTNNKVSEAQADWMGKDLAGINDYDEVKKFLKTKLAKNKNDAIDFLQTEKAMADKSENKANNLLVFIKNFSRDLAGKTNPIDRPFQENLFGRKALGVVNFFNSRFKANAVLGNLSSSVAQFFNIPQGFASAGVKNSAKGLGDSLAGIFKKNTPIQKSSFIKERYFNEYNKFDTGLLDNTKKFAVWITGVGDEIGTKFIWNSHYRKALSEGIENPIKYADDWTRKMVAGRGIGEVPIAQKSKIVQSIAPFQLEVANMWHALNDIAKNDPRKVVVAKKMIEFAVASFLMNRLAKGIRGSDVSFDPFNAMMEAYNEFSEEESKIKGAVKFGGRIAGEVLSNLPGGGMLASAYPEYGTEKLPPRKEFFGEGDPTRFGTGGLPMFSALRNPLTGVVTPYGGKQIEKTISGIKALKNGYVANKSGAVVSPVERTINNLIKGTAFGKNAFSEVQEYYDNNQKPLSEGQSEKFKLMNNSKKYFDSIIADRKADKEKESFKTGNIQMDSKQISDDIYQLSNGKFYSEFLNSEFETIEKAKLEVVKEEFKNSENNFMDLGDRVLRKTEDGMVQDLSKTKFNSMLNGAKLILLKKNDDIENWKKTAEEQFDILNEMLISPSVDELEKIEIQSKMETLIDDYQKFKSYGGFTKPKKAKEEKELSVDPSLIEIKLMRAFGGSRKPSSSLFRPNTRTIRNLSRKKRNIILRKK